MADTPEVTGEQVQERRPASSHDDGERAAKRLKMDSAAVQEDMSHEPAQNGTSKDTSGTPAMSEEKKLDGSTSSAPAVETQDGNKDAKPDENTADGYVDGRSKGMAPIKQEFLVDVTNRHRPSNDIVDDDAAEAGVPATVDARDAGKKSGKDRKKQKGQNKDRTYGNFQDAIKLCNTRAHHSEFSPAECRFGDKCRLEHDLRKYLEEGRRGDLEVWDGKCPSFADYGRCPSGWKCRFVRSHMKEIEHEDGRKELTLVTTEEKKGENGEKEDAPATEEPEDIVPGIFNIVSIKDKLDLSRKRVDFSKSDQYIGWLNHETKTNVQYSHGKDAGKDDNRAMYTEPPFKASEKKRLYFGPETPALAPLTTQGNLPFRRLCVELGAQLTYSEMALGQPLVQGQKSDWTLMKAHESELTPPKLASGAVPVFDYNNANDIRFGAQISSNQHWAATKAADALHRFCPHLRLIDLNCGCPIDAVFKSGGGSALLDAHSKLERMIRGMNAMSGEIPITAKIRTGVKTNRPTAPTVIGRLAFGSRDNRDRLGAPGCAAVTLHGRSREARYTKSADWTYIAECAALVKSYNVQKAELTDTVAEPDASTLPNSKNGRMYFLGNGDCFSHHDYFEHIEKAKVDSVMIGRGALIKPWIFEEIEKGQYLDKSSTERLAYIEKFVRYGLEAWGSDELGVGFTRRFLLEWLSFTCRYVPIGILEHLPPAINDRPPAYRGRDDLETLMASNNYKDWIKISEMFLGPVQAGFEFLPKHKSNAYEAEG